MDSLERALIEKTGYSHGFENIQESDPSQVRLFSARHPAAVQVSPSATGSWRVAFEPAGPWVGELSRAFPLWTDGQSHFDVPGEIELARLFRRASDLACALPNQVALEFEQAVQDAPPLSATESLAVIRRRIGQDLFRDALLQYWGGACAVTGIALPELLRASHAKPWADCATDAERLNVFNGFLLCAHLDALFDRGLLTFTPQGDGLVSPYLPAGTLARLGLGGGLRLRWIRTEHHLFLDWHRKKVFRAGP